MKTWPKVLVGVVILVFGAALQAMYGPSQSGLGLRGQRELDRDSALPLKEQFRAVQRQPFQDQLNYDLERAMALFLRGYAGERAQKKMRTEQEQQDSAKVQELARQVALIDLAGNKPSISEIHEFTDFGTLEFSFGESIQTGVSRLRALEPKPLAKLPQNLPGRAQEGLVKDTSQGENEQGITVRSQELICLIRQDGSVQEIMRLIKKGAQVNACSLHGMTPLMVAARKNRGPICALLIAKGARLNVKDHEGKTPLDQLASSTKT